MLKRPEDENEPEPDAETLAEKKKLGKLIGGAFDEQNREITDPGRF